MMSTRFMSDLIGGLVIAYQLQKLRHRCPQRKPEMQPGRSSFSRAGPKTKRWHRLGAAAPLLGDSVLPVARLTAAMRHRHDEYEVRFDRVKDSIRENSGEATTNVLVEWTPTRWVFKDHFHGVLDTFYKAQIQTALLLWVLMCG